MREDVQQDLQGRCQWEIIVLEYFREIHDTGTFDREVIGDLVIHEVVNGSGVFQCAVTLGF